MIQVHTNQSDLLGGPGLPPPPFEITTASSSNYLFFGSSHALPICFALPLTPNGPGPTNVPGCIPTQTAGMVAIGALPVAKGPQTHPCWSLVFLSPGTERNMFIVILSKFQIMSPFVTVILEMILIVHHGLRTLGLKEFGMELISILGFHLGNSVCITLRGLIFIVQKQMPWHLGL